MLANLTTRGGKSMRHVFLFFVLISLAVPVAAREIADVSVPETIKLENGIPLQLNGAGIRYKLFFKIYIAQLYMQYPSSNIEKIIEDKGFKRVVMHFLYDEVSSEKLVEGWNIGFDGNCDEEQLANLKTRIADFNGMFNDVKRGDEILLDYVPEKGTEVIIRGESKGVITGKDFNDSLLLIWLGQKPVSSDLREELTAYSPQ